MLEQDVRENDLMNGVITKHIEGGTTDMQCGFVEG